MISGNDIDIDNTITTNKLCLKKNSFFERFNLFILYAIIIALPSAAIGYEVVHYKTEDVWSSIFTILIPLLFCAFGFDQFYNRNKLVRVPNVKKASIISILEELKWDIIENESDFMMIQTDVRNRIITIVFDKPDALFHSLRYSRGNEYYFIENWKRDILIEKIKQFQANN